MVLKHVHLVGPCLGESQTNAKVTVGKLRTLARRVSAACQDSESAEKAVTAAIIHTKESEICNDNNWFEEDRLQHRLLEDLFYYRKRVESRETDREANASQFHSSH